MIYMSTSGITEYLTRTSYNQQLSSFIRVTVAMCRNVKLSENLFLSVVRSAISDRMVLTKSRESRCSREKNENVGRGVCGVKNIGTRQTKIAYQSYHQCWVIGKQGIIQTRNYVWP